ETDTGAVLDAGRDIDRQRAVARDAARSGARRTWILDHLAAALAPRASALEREEALGMSDAAGAVARWAGLGPRSGLGATARARLAGHRGGDADLRGLAGEGVLEADLHVVAQIGTALAPGAAAAAGTAHAEQVVEDVGECRGKVGAEAAGCP